MSEYSELIKNYNKIRDYMRDFYVYGFRVRESYKNKSARTYDNEKRRLESYLNDIVAFNQDKSGKKVFLTVDNSEFFANPFYKSFKTKSFTKKDITLHFAVIYLLKKYGKMSLAELEKKIYSEILSFFEKSETIDTATLRNKLKEYIDLGLIEEVTEKNKKIYSLVNIMELDELFDAICFFSENFPLGVIGSFILDRFEEKNCIFTSKHKYLLDVVDSELILELMIAISNRELVEIEYYAFRKQKIKIRQIIPLKIAITTQSGRNYLFCVSKDDKMFSSVRLDSIVKITHTNETVEDFLALTNSLEQRLNYTWGVYLSNSNKIETLKMTISVKDNEKYILERIEKEGRIGRLEKVGENLYCYTVKAYDLEEVRPWLRTFIGRIESLECSICGYSQNFFDDIEMMKKNYSKEEEL